MKRILSLLLCAGCLLGPDFERPEAPELPDTFRTTGDAARSTPGGSAATPQSQRGADPAPVPAPVGADAHIGPLLFSDSDIHRL